MSNHKFQNDSQGAGIYQSIFDNVRFVDEDWVL